MSRLQKFFQLSLDIMCIANWKGEFVDVNDVFANVVGYSRDELLLKNFFDLMHPDDVPLTEAVIEKMNSVDSIRNFENRYKHADGTFRVLSWSASVDEESGLIFAMARDVTEEVRIRDRLLQIEAGLKSETILAETDQKGRITFVNDQFCKISGYSRSELIGKTHRIINSGHHSKEFFAELWVTISSGSIWKGVIRNRKKNGDYYYVQTIIMPLRDAAEDISGYLAVRQDLTDSIKHEAAFTNTLKILNETSSIAKVGGWALEVETSELTWTDETFKILEVEKRNDQKPMLPEGLELFIPEHQLTISNAVNRAIESGEPYELEVQASTAKGNILWVYTNGKANYKDGKVVSLSGTIQDIQLRKTAQLKYDKERQNSMQNAKMASLGELAASMAHEINNPLGIIIGYADLLLETGVENKDITRVLGSIHKASERIAHIVQGLKKFSRTDSELGYVRSNLGLVVLEAIDLATPRLKNQLVELKLIGSTDKEIVCSAIEIEQVLVNLINNSIDAVSELSEKWITVEVSDSDGKVIVEVTDSGYGIPDDFRYKIFEPFFTTKPVGRGTGLGLSIIAGILEDHSAEINYQLKEGHTSFRLTFQEAQSNDPS